MSRFVTGLTIIPDVNGSAALRRFYQDAYSHDPESSARYASSRALGAVRKADHVEHLPAFPPLGALAGSISLQNERIPR